jgi:hypothetical protein
MLPANPAPPSPIHRDPIEYSVLSTTQGLRKSASLLVSDPLRELVVRKNDSCFAIFGIVNPHLVDASQEYSRIDWDLAADSGDIVYWGDIPACLRTVSFTVPTNGAFEYGNELFAAFPDDLDSSAVIRIQFRDAATHEVLLSTSIDMSGYSGDTALYVLDMHDLSEIGGRDVYFCVDLADTTSALSWEVHVITAIDTLQQEKSALTSAPLPEGIYLEQNIPNPFNPVTTIMYGVDEDCHVDIRVYDRLGRFVTALVSEWKPAGHHRTQFMSGSLPSGVYYYRMHAMNRFLTKKMVLIR